MKSFLAFSSFALISAFFLLSPLIDAQKVVAECTKGEIDDLMMNSNVRNCASNYEDLLPKKECTSLLDQSCYCHSPQFMVAMTACLFKEEPDVQDQLLRCGKWYSCSTLAPALNDSNVILTPESIELLTKAKASAIANGARPRLLVTVGGCGLVTLVATLALIL